jgi:hypothetical protein
MRENHILQALSRKQLTEITSSLVQQPLPPCAAGVFCFRKVAGFDFPAKRQRNTAPGV